MKARLSIIALLFGIAATARASAIVLSFSGIATGVLGTTPFADQHFLVASSGDTASAFVTAGPDYNLPALVPIINIGGFGAATFTDAMSWIDPQGSGDIIFNDALLNSELLGFTELFEGLETYQFQTSIGPVSGGFPFIPNIFENFQNIPTSQGLLTITSTSANVFTAMVSTPEPSSAWLAVASLGALLLIRKRSSKYELGCRYLLVERTVRGKANTVHAETQSSQRR
jgi:MYXO-CTERM domain-containing protein